MSDPSVTLPVLQSWLPGLRLLRNYNKQDLSGDLIAGVSVAAVAIPIGIAYSDLAGAVPVVGIYSCLLPPVAYALFGSSRQLIVNPDAAACAIVAATTAPLAASDPQRYADLSIVLTLFTGILCILAGIARLGVIANFLSRPILIGYLNGIAISIIVGQLGKLLAINIPSGGVFKTLVNLFKHLGETQLVTMLLGVSLLVGLLIIKRFARQLPGPLLAAVAGICLVYFLQLKTVHVIGAIPAGLPTPHIPTIGVDDLVPLIMGASTIVLVSFCSMMTTARGFAARNGYQIDANRDLFALGVCDLASGLSRGFVVSGADSRTAVADSSGGKSQVTSLVASLAIALVLLFLTAPLAYLPTAALAAILVSSSIGLFDFRSLRRYYRISKAEFCHAGIAMLGVMTVGVLKGILVAVALAILRLLMLASRPHDAVLGTAPGTMAVSDLRTDPSVRGIPGLVIYRFDASIVFFNADHFAHRVRQVLKEAEHKPAWLLLDTESIPITDATGAETIASLHAELQRDGIVLAIARPKGWFLAMLERTGVVDVIGEQYHFTSIHAGIEAFARQNEQTGEGNKRNENY